MTPTSMFVTTALALTVTAIGQGWAEDAVSAQITRATEDVGYTQIADSGQWRKAKEAEIKTRYSGNTLIVIAKRSGKEIRILYSPNSTWTAKCCGDSWRTEWSGKWTAEGNVYCRHTETGRRAGTFRCVQFVTDGKEWKTDKVKTDGTGWTDQATASGMIDPRIVVGNKLP